MVRVDIARILATAATAECDHEINQKTCPLRKLAGQGHDWQGAKLIVFALVLDIMYAILNNLRSIDEWTSGCMDIEKKPFIQQKAVDEAK
jgi:hypothetical protein